jgi:chromosome segregation ATPase
MPPLILLAAAALAAAAAAPSLEPSAELAALKLAANAQIGAVNAFLQTPVGADRKAALREAVDAVVREGAACSRAALALDGALAEPGRFLDGQLRGSRSLDKRSEGVGPARDRAAARLAAGQRETAALKRAAEQETDPKKKKRLEEQLAEAEPALRKAEQAAAALASAAGALGEARDDARAKSRRAQGPAAEALALSSEVQKLAASMAEPAAALIARIDKLGEQPEAENRTRFNYAIDPLLDPARNVYARSNSAHDRFDRACDDYARAAAASGVFDETLEACEERLAAADAALKALEWILARR